MFDSNTMGSATAGQTHSIHVHRVAHHVLRLLLATVFLALGYTRFFAFEADGVEPLIGARTALS